MSSYVNFYVKNQQGEYTPLASFSRSTQIYSAIKALGFTGEELNDEKWGWITYAIPFQESGVQSVIADLEIHKDNCKKNIENYRDNINLIMSSNSSSSLEERLEYVDTYKQGISEEEEEVDCLQTYISYMNFLNIVRDENRPHPDEREVDDTILVGIDAVPKGKEEEFCTL